MIRRYLLALTSTICASPAREARIPEYDKVTVPLTVEGNRPFIQLSFRKADGTIRTARFLIDTGGGGFLITEPLARELGLKWGAVEVDEGSQFAVAKADPTVTIGDFPLALTAGRTIVVMGGGNILPPVAPGSAEGTIPGHLLAKYHVVFDYPFGQFTIARPGVLTPRGTVLPMPVSKKQGFPRTEITLGGKTYGMLLDTGASFSMVSEVALKAWGSAHPDWPRYPGAYLPGAKMLGGMALETMIVPDARWGPLDLPSIGVVSQREGTFERYMSGMMTAPIIGSLANEVLLQFRVELDYAHEKLYLTRRAM